MAFGVSELWQVNFTAPGLPASVWQRKAPTLPTIVNVDEINCRDARLINNTWAATKSQLGRFKSPGGQIIGNRFAGPWAPGFWGNRAGLCFLAAENVFPIEVGRADAVFFCCHQNQPPVL